MRPSLFRARAGASCVVLSILCASAGCVGDVGGEDQRGDPGGPITDEAADEVGVSGMRRLAVSEYRASVRDLVGVDATAAREILPADTLVPFDNDFTQQTASEALVKGVELLAGDIAGTVAPASWFASRRGPMTRRVSGPSSNGSGAARCGVR
jgi:hypothetical protein